MTPSAPPYIFAIMAVIMFAAVFHFGWLHWQSGCRADTQRRTAGYIFGVAVGTALLAMLLFDVRILPILPYLGN